MCCKNYSVNIPWNFVMSVTPVLSFGSIQKKLWEILLIVILHYFVKVKSEHRSKFFNLSNWREEAWKISASTGFEAVSTLCPHWVRSWSPDIFQASSLQLLKLKNLLWCSLHLGFNFEPNVDTKWTRLRIPLKLIFVTLLPSHCLN